MTVMEAVAAHNRMGAAIRKVGQQHPTLHDTDLRVLMTVAANGGQATHYEARDAMGPCCGTQVRRSSLALRECGAISVEGSDGGPNRRGIVTRMRLTDVGRRICDEVTAAFHEAGQ